MNKVETGARDTGMPGGAGVESRLVQLDEWIAVDPGNAKLWVDRIRFSLDRNRTEGLVEICASAASRFPGEPVFHHLQGQALLACGDPDAAAKIFSRLFERTGDPTLAADLAIALFRCGRFESVVDLLHSLPPKSVLPARTIEVMLRSYLALGRIAEAANVVERLRDADALPVQLRGLAGLICFDGGHFEQAKLLAAEERLAGTRSLEGALVETNAGIAEGNLEQANEALQVALTLGPDEGRTHSARGILLLQEQRFEMAEDALRRAAEAMPSHIGSWHALAWCQIVRQRLDEAEASFNRANAIDQNFGETHGGLAVIAAMRGDEAKARRLSVTARRLNPQGMAVSYAALLLAGRGRDPESLAHFVKRVTGTGGLRS